MSIPLVDRLENPFYKDCPKHFCDDPLPRYVFIGRLPITCAKKKRKKGLTKRELRSLYPELYKDLEESRPKLPQDLQDQLDEIKEQKKRQREEILESMRK